LDKSRLHYGWVVALFTFLTLLVAAGALFSAGVLIVPFEKWFAREPRHRIPGGVDRIPKTIDLSAGLVQPLPVAVD
jgi:hypothetical protein